MDSDDARGVASPKRDIVEQERALLEEHLEELKRAGFLERLSKDKCAFTNHPTWEVVYKSLMFSERRRFHGVVAAYLEQSVGRTDDIADLCEASAWDLQGLEEYQPDAKTRDHFKNMLSPLYDAVYKMRQAIMFLEQNSDKAVELAMEVDAAERDADSAHRSFTQFLYKSNLDIKVLLRLKDLGQHLEEIADAAEDAADAVRIIAIARV